MVRFCCFASRMIEFTDINIIKRSSNLHFVDAEGKSCLPAFRTYASSHHSYLPHLSDNPPTSCSVDEERDCADGRCIRELSFSYFPIVALTVRCPTGWFLCGSQRTGELHYASFGHLPRRHADPGGVEVSRYVHISSSH